MKKIMQLLLCLYMINVVSQTFKQIDNFSNYIGKSFLQLEKDNKLSPTGKKKNFGLESRSYEFNNFFILASEVDDTKNIGEINYFTNDDKNNSEKWYLLSNEMNSNPEYSFISAFIADPKDKITTSNLNYKELINLLRNSIGTKDYVFEVIFQKGKVYTKINYTLNYINIETRSTPFK